MNTIAIIGAGPSGLVTAKEALQCGLTPVIFEQGNSIGGVWNQERGSTWKSMRTNNSCNSSNFSDYDWDKESDDFPNQKAVYDYLCSYAKDFNIMNTVLLQSRVTRIEKEGNKWYVEWIRNTSRNSAIFSYVAVCSGIFSKAYIPPVVGIASFSGYIFHSQNYKTPSIFRGKRVAVIGNSFSGCDIAAEISKTAKVFHLFEKAKWIHTRYLRQGNTHLPFDLTYSRSAQTRNYRMDPSQYNETAYKKLNALCGLQAKVDQDLAITGPATDPQKVAISDAYLRQVEEGKIIPIKCSIERIFRNAIILSSKSSKLIISNIESIVFCTGYTAKLPFFSPEIQSELDFKEDDIIQPLPLYKTVFHPNLQNLAFVGLTRVGIYFGLIELQARFACMAFSGKIPMPSKKIMEEGVSEEKNIRDVFPRPQFSHNYFSLCDKLAIEIGAMPDFERLKMQDTDLYEKLWNGPFTVAQYRLVGFGKNPELALQKIDSLVRRVPIPMSNLTCVYDENQNI